MPLPTFYGLNSCQTDGSKEKLKENITVIDYYVSHDGASSPKLLSYQQMDSFHSGKVGYCFSS